MSSAADPRRRPRSIAWLIFGLVIASVVVAVSAIFVVTFDGPPQRGPGGGSAAIVRALRSGEAAAGLRVQTLAAPPAPHGPFHVDPAAGDRLAQLLGVPRDRVAALTMRPPGEDDRVFGRDFILGWRDGDRWRVVETPRPLLAPWHLKTLAAMAIAILALAIPGWALARAISQPLEQVARAAAQARANATLPPLPRGGAREVRDLAGAVAAMHARLAAHAEGRTTMLAAIAHDLGTPLSRLAFRVESLPEASRERALADIAEMRAMIAAALAFARDERSDTSLRVDIGSLMQSLADDMADAGHPVAVDPGPRAIVRADPAALRRLFGNLVDNAIRYGGRAQIGWQVERERLVATVDDDGPGIDPAMAERLFEPFVRGDPSRNRATGGTGLGLAIARSIAQHHGGEVTLANRSGGGARALVVLPLA